MSEQNLIVGFDLCNLYSQISCYNYKTFEPESICVTKDKSKYLIPTVLGVKNTTKEWVFGEEAYRLNEEGTGVLIDNLIQKLEENEETDIYGVPFKPVALLEKFMRKCLYLLKLYYPSNSILKLVVTLKELNETIVDQVYQALGSLGIERDRALVQSHAESYGYYALSQSKELWLNDVGLFEFDENGLTYQLLSINRKSHPYLVSIAKKDFSEILNLESLSEMKEQENKEYTFSNLAKSSLHKQIVSTLYITGIGFEGSWADNVLKELCVGRRVFKGQNLYTKGACYAAKELSGESKLKDFLFLGSDMITSTFSIAGYYNAKMAEAVLAKAATPWYQVDEKMDLILDEIKEISVFRKDMVNHAEETYNISLEGLPNRPNKTTRVELRLKFLSRTTAIITVKDKGFGDFYPSSSRIWEKEINL